MIKREAYMSRIRPFIGTELIKVLTGIRRGGKSVMLELIQEELAARGVSDTQIIKLNFEDMRNAHLCTAEALRAEVATRIAGIGGIAYLFFDEIQDVADWEKCVNSLRVEFKCDIYVTGSNAKLLSGELATYLAGRYVEFVVYPFSFQEYSDMYAESFPDAPPREIFAKYLTLGGMPFINNTAVNEKYYIADHGIREAVYGDNIKDINLVLENIVYMELLRRGYKVTVGKAGTKEIDFVCEDRQQKLYIQVSYLLASPETVEREFGAFDYIRDNFPKYVLSLDEFDMSRNGYKHRNIRDFLLMPAWD